MSQMAHHIGQELRWEQPSKEREYQLRSGDQTVATLRFRSPLGSLATAESSEGCWSFKRVGFMRPTITVRPCNAEIELASFTNNTWSGGGSLELASGRKLLASTSFWTTQYELASEEGVALVRYKRESLAKASAIVLIEPAAAELAELAWLVPFGWYLSVVPSMEQSAHSGNPGMAGFS